ncbi:MAG: hypothetical protein PHE48_00700 [Candidatus Daviesbacteria bacterium]|nr:hypothetical protein [Candidatus Daviesbacteria bacterium]
MQRGSAQLLVVFIAVTALAAGGYYYLSAKGKNPLPAINANVAPLKTLQSSDYANQSLGFGFTYPKRFFAKDDSEDEFNKRGNGDFRKNFKGYVGYEPGKFLGAAVVLDKNNDYEQNPFTVWVFNNPQNLSIDNWYKNYWYYPFVWGDFTYSGKVVLAPKEEATISGQPAKSGVIDYQPGKPKFIYVAKDGKMYLFRVIGETGNQILSTFKFLK